MMVKMYLKTVILMVKVRYRELDIPFYEPMLIVEKMAGRMAEDNFWIKIER